MNCKRLLFVFLIFCFYNCGNTVSTESLYSSVKIESIVEDSLLNIRALELTKDKLVAVSSIADVYSFDLNSDSLSKDRFYPDSLNVRALALVADTVFTLSIGSPAYLYKNSELVYHETDSAVFYDSMNFWNSKEGIALGDPIDACLSILITRDGGNTWRKTPCASLPKTIKGEAAFAASDTNISIVGNNAWIASGGVASRVLFSDDKGLSWEVFDTPIVQGTPTKGIYSIDFYDEHNGYAIGGDYTQPKLNSNTKIKSTDGGRSWRTVNQIGGPGYRSCVQYVPGRRAKDLVAVGFEGIDYSANGGLDWIKLSKTGFYTIRFLNDSIAFAAGKGRLAKLIFD